MNSSAGDDAYLARNKLLGVATISGLMKIFESFDSAEDGLRSFENAGRAL